LCSPFEQEKSQMAHVEYVAELGFGVNNVFKYNWVEVANVY